MEQNWPELMKNYGPFALLPFTVLVIERLAAKRAHDKRLPEGVRNGVYATAWVMIFVLCGLVVFFWYLSLPAAKEAMMRGRVTGLKAGNTLRASGPETANVRVFTYRDPQQADQLFWRTYSVNPLPDSTSLSFLIDNGDSTREETWRFLFLTRRQYYEPATELHFELKLEEKQLILRNTASGEPEILTGELVVVAASPVNPVLPQLPWVATVWAQTRPSAGVAIANLEANDPLVRLTARKQLASIGPEALKEMDKVLTTPGSTYRAKLGVIVAANQMTAFRPETFGLSAWCEVWKSAQADDQTMKSQANLLLKKQSQTFTTARCRQAQATIAAQKAGSKTATTAVRPAPAARPTSKSLSSR